MQNKTEQPSSKDRVVEEDVPRNPFLLEPVKRRVVSARIQSIKRAGRGSVERHDG